VHPRNLIDFGPGELGAAVALALAGAGIAGLMPAGWFGVGGWLELNDLVDQLGGRRGDRRGRGLTAGIVATRIMPRPHCPIRSEKNGNARGRHSDRA
jgi:hypothetical protein